jgi:hypothetical protein
MFWITCANEPSKAWLMQKISRLGELWEGAELTVVDSKDLLKRPKVLASIPDTSEVAPVMTRLKIQNAEFNTTDWSVMSRKVAERKPSLLTLTHSNFKAFWGLGRIIFWTLKDDERSRGSEYHK